MQADARFRSNVAQVKRLTVRNTNGDMVPIGSIATVKGINGPLMFTRYNMHAAGQIRGQAAGMSSRQAIDMMQDLAHRYLPHTMQYEWTEMAFLELQAADTAMLIFGLSSIAVFLVLAAQYESWSLPLAVILVVPMCLLSAIIGVWVMPRLLPQSLVGTNPQIDINIFTEIGFVVLLGLASKDDLESWRFAKRQPRKDSLAARRLAAACRLRLRPIIMTSFAFILGVSPLLVAHGPGGNARTLGTAVFSGMLGVTVFGIFTLLTPVFFCVVDTLTRQPRFSVRDYCRQWTWYLTLARVRARFRQDRRAAVRQPVVKTDHGLGLDVEGLEAELDRSESAVEPATTDRKQRAKDSYVSPPSSSTARSSPPCCRSSSRWPAGSAVWLALPIARIPRRSTPPTVEVSAIYPGAGRPGGGPAPWPARPIEQQVNGDIEGLCSTCRRNAPTTVSSCRSTVTFKLGVDLNIAQVLVQNRCVAVAQPLLPDLVVRKGVTVKKKSPSGADDREPLLARQEPRQPIPQQLRHDPHPRRADARAGRRRRHLSGPARLQHEALARPRQDAPRRPFGGRRGGRHPAAKHPGGRGPDRPAARARRAGLPVHHDHAWPALRSRAVRADDAQERQRRPRRADEGRRPHRARRAGLRPDLHVGRQSFRGPLGLSVAGHQRPAHGPGWSASRKDGQAPGPSSRRGSNTRSSTTPRPSSQSRLPRSSSRWSMRCFWSRSSCSCSCRTGARPSFRWWRCQWQ